MSSWKIQLLAVLIVDVNTYSTTIYFVEGVKSSIVKNQSCFVSPLKDIKTFMWNPVTLNVFYNLGELTLNC